jgi:hypothetical protein
MLNGSEDKSRRRSPVEAPCVEPFHLPRAGHARPRPVAIDAMACFLATALGSLAPQALSLFDLAPATAVVGAVVPADGKFTDRVLIGGLQTLNWDAPATATPAFVKAPAPTVAATEPAPARAIPTPPARPARDLAQRRPDKAPEPRLAEASAPAPVPAATPASPSAATPADATRPGAEPVAEAKPAAPAEHGPLAVLAPAGLTSRLAPIGEKMVNGAKAVGGAVASGLAWIGY